MLQRATSNVYSWWWASHIRTKQSKWLDEDLHGQSLLEISLRILLLLWFLLLVGCDCLLKLQCGVGSIIIPNFVPNFHF